VTYTSYDALHYAVFMLQI